MSKPDSIYNQNNHIYSRKFAISSTDEAYRGASKVEILINTINIIYLSNIIKDSTMRY